MSRYPHVAKVRDAAHAMTLQQRCRHGGLCGCAPNLAAAMVDTYIALTDFGWTLTPPPDQAEGYRLALLRCLVKVPLFGGDAA